MAQLTKQEAWDRIADAFERFSNGEFNGLAATGICNAVAKLQEEELICPMTRVEMSEELCFALMDEDLCPGVICWPITPEGAASRCEFIRKHFLPAGCSDSHGVQELHSKSA